MNRVNELKSAYNKYSSTKRRLQRAKSSRGRLVKTQKEISRAVTAEIALRHGEIAPISESIRELPVVLSPLPRSPMLPRNVSEPIVTDTSCLIVRNNAMAATEIEEENRRYHCELYMQYAGERKPYVNEKLIAPRTRVYQLGNVVGVRTADVRIVKRQAACRRASHRYRERKSELRKY